jgi:hypothetical protein
MWIYPLHSHREQGTVAVNLCPMTALSYATGSIENRELWILDSINISGIRYHFLIKIELGVNVEVLGVNRHIMRSGELMETLKNVVAQRVTVSITAIENSHWNMPE